MVVAAVGAVGRLLLGLIGHHSGSPQGRNLPILYRAKTRGSFKK